MKIIIITLIIILIPIKLSESHVIIWTKLPYVKNSGYVKRFLKVEYKHCK